MARRYFLPLPHRNLAEHRWLRSVQVQAGVDTEDLEAVLLVEGAAVTTRLVIELILEYYLLAHVEEV